MRPSTLLIPVLMLLTACDRNSAQVEARKAATAADARVAALEAELKDLRAAHGKAPETKDQERVLERLIKDAKARAQNLHQAAEAPAPPVAKAVPVEVPVGTALLVRLKEALATERQAAGDPWQGTLAEPVTVGGRTVWPSGTSIRGVVTQSVPAGRLQSGVGGLSLRVTHVGDQDVMTGVHGVTGTARGERNATYIGGGAALGALVGALSGSKHRGDHALGGAAIGAAAGTAVAAGTADTVIRIGTEKPIRFALTQPERVMVRP